jgi:hypothetical protein
MLARIEGKQEKNIQEKQAGSEGARKFSDTRNCDTSGNMHSYERRAIVIVSRLWFSNGSSMGSRRTRGNINITNARVQ